MNDIVEAPVAVVEEVDGTDSEAESCFGGGGGGGRGLTAGSGFVVVIGFCVGCCCFFGVKTCDANWERWYLALLG